MVKVCSILCIVSGLTLSHLFDGFHFYRLESHGLLAIYVKLWVAHAPGMPGTFSPPPRLSDPDMHHGMCMKSVAGKMFPAFPGAWATRNFTYLVRGPLSICMANPYIFTYSYCVYKVVFIIEPHELIIDHQCDIVWIYCQWSNGKYGSIDHA